ncbi:receptor-type tyrosine-protein phosphatase mu-like isoform X2 [Mya arenaria]|uniref:receptor-type tyrosine-protein phosphatase mu-like isoform X2 n=1 Tax=Mya arenaria TaxID=6604 RepID=UPI0022E12A7C|nr:receptor-type tyrosine-protein phosphatase mu-like isoform X2 [Mya arenaria]
MKDSKLLQETMALSERTDNFSEPDFNQGVISLRIVDDTMYAIFDQNLTDYIHTCNKTHSIGDWEQHINALLKIQSSAEKEEKAITSIKKEPIHVEQFLQKLRQKKLDKYLKFEVRAIVRNQEEHPCTIATLPDNVTRNVCQDVVSFDHSLVTLRDIPPGDDSSYINASYIEGYHGDIEYIATQGPRGKTMAAFWHLVWQENVHVIVMATGLFENAAQQCDKYWGNILSVQKYVRQGNIHIVLKDTLELSKLVIRTFQICKDGCDETRIVKHYEMSGFTDEGTDPGFLLDVRRRINRTLLTSPGPMLVHCRCGGGRTATFIAIDYCLKQLEHENFVDIYSTVLCLRKFRTNMVQTLSQYRLIYDTLAMYVQVWTTVIPASQLPAVAHKLMLKNQQTNTTGYEKEFQFLQQIVPKILIGDCASGHRDENRNKSRDIMLLPPERARPYLQTIETNDMGTDFINAVFVDGYRQENSYIATQWPMQGTINDIWRLLFDFKINTLVVLNDNKIHRSTPCFWPKALDKEVKYGPIGVKYLGCQKYPHIIIRAFAIRKLPNTRYNDLFLDLDTGQVSMATALPFIDLLTKSRDSLVVKMFHYTSWHTRDLVPTSTRSFLYMMGCVDEWQQKNNPLSTVCVMSKDGYSKCGLYGTLAFCCDQLHCEGEVDIFNAARIVKKNRSQLINTLAEYIYCYTYMSLVVHLMQDDSPKFLVTTPTVIEGEIQHGYELLTGFENVLSGKPLDKNEKHGGTNQLKNQNLMTAFMDENEVDSLDSNDRLYCPGFEAYSLPPRSENLDNGHRKSSGLHVKENGHINKNVGKQSRSTVNVSAPKAPGHIHTWEDERCSQYNENSKSQTFPRRESNKRRPLFRQNAQEMNELCQQASTSTQSESFESSYL